MVTVFVHDNESIESALKRFSKKVQDARIILEVKERQAYVKPSDQRRRDAAAGKARCAKKQRKTEKMLEFLSNNKVPPRRPRPNNSNNSNNPNSPTQPYNRERRPQQSNYRNDRQKRTVYVGGLSYSTIEESLLNHFSTAARVESAKIILDRETQKSRGFGFVELSSEADVQVVIDAFHETEFEGRRIVVSANKTKEEKEKERKAATPPPVNATEEELLDLQAKFNSKAV